MRIKNKNKNKIKESRFGSYPILYLVSIITSRLYYLNMYNFSIGREKFLCHLSDYYFTTIVQI